MKKIGGIFPLEETMENGNGFFEKISQGSDTRFLLSGRCAIYYALLDLAQKDKKKVAYLPLYTCETVVAPFKKAGYTLKFYSFDKNMNPVFDYSMLKEISLISICGYYGFCNYDREFVKKCKEKGIYIIEDATHSVLSSDGIDENCDYIVGSLRKWMGVASGGFAIKKKGKFLFEPKPVHQQHLNLRYDAVLNNDLDTFWKGEMLLREIFDCYAGDDKSSFIMTHADYKNISRKRRENYQFLLDNFKSNEEIKVVFPVLPQETVPSHFTVFAKDREKVQSYLSALDIKSSVFWPQGPYINLENESSTQYIYDHVMSLVCDQRFSTEEMITIANALNSYR